jgi:hypothetical protein
VLFSCVSSSIALHNLRVTSLCVLSEVTPISPLTSAAADQVCTTCGMRYVGEKSAVRSRSNLKVPHIEYQLVTFRFMRMRRDVSEHNDTIIGSRLVFKPDKI